MFHAGAWQRLRSLQHSPPAACGTHQGRGQGRGHSRHPAPAGYPERRRLPRQDEVGAAARGASGPVRALASHATQRRSAPFTVRSGETAPQASLPPRPPPADAPHTPRRSSLPLPPLVALAPPQRWQRPLWRVRRCHPRPAVLPAQGPLRCLQLFACHLRNELLVENKYRLRRAEIF